MKVNPVKLKKIIQKSSFNYRLAGARILFANDKITCNMVSPNNSYAVLIDAPNDVMSGIRRKNSVELNLDLNNEPFSRRVFNQFDSDECGTSLTKQYLVISDGNFEASFDLTSDLDSIALTDNLPEFSVTSETKIDIDEEFIATVLKLCKAAQESKEIEINFVVSDSKPSLGIIKEGTALSSIGVSGSVTGDTNKEFTMPFSRVDIKDAFNLIKSEREKEYKIYFVYDDSKNSGYATIISNDEAERYILFSKRVNTESELIDIRKEQFESKPELPETWNYDESVTKVKSNFYKWKNLTQEIFKELWIAREVLSKSKSEAAEIMHGTLVPWMTWTQYCEDIGSSRQVVNRWLKQAFYGHLLQSEPDSSIDVLFRSARKVVGKSKKKIVDAYNGRKAPDQIEKIVQDIESGTTDEAIVHVNNKYTYREWFKPLFDGYICFANDPQGSCFVYLGDKRDEFVSEFSKHGVVMAKVE